jgi:hypothetical protein
MLEIQVLALDRHTDVVGLNRLIGSQPAALENWIFNGNTYINKIGSSTAIHIHV